jgi:hypothetical protein
MTYNLTIQLTSDNITLHSIPNQYGHFSILSKKRILFNVPANCIGKLSRNWPSMDFKVLLIAIYLKILSSQ